MDKLSHYQHLIKQFMTEFAALANRQPKPDSEMVTIFDDIHQHYLLLKLGWQEHQRLHHVTLHVRLRYDQIWIEEDWTEDGIAAWLIRQQVPPSDLVAGCTPPELRPLTEWAVI
jgi:hypothetical protein